MGLTRPNAAQITTVVSTISDPLTVLNQGATSANIDIGFIMNRGNAANVAFVWQESSKQFILATTSSTGVTNANVTVSSYANLQAGNITTGNITAAHYIGDGSLLTGITTTYSNVQVAQYLPIYSGALSGSTVTIGSTVLVLTSSSVITSIGTSATALDTFATATYRSAKYVISINDITNTQFQTCELVLVQDGTTATIGTYGSVWSGTTNRMNFTATIASGTLTLYGTGVSANNTVKLVRTLIPV